MATCTEFKNNDFPTDMNLDVSCSEANVSAGPVSLSNGASMNLTNSGSFNLQDLSTDEGGNITIGTSGDMVLNNVTCGADLTLTSFGTITLNGTLNVKGNITIQSGGVTIINQSIIQDEGLLKISCGGELMIKESVTQVQGGSPSPIDITAFGKITISGPIKGQKDVIIESTGNMLQIDNTIEGAGAMSFKAPSGEVMITKDITQEDSPYIDTMRIDARRKITVNGQITGKKNILIESTGNMIQVDKSIIYDGDTGNEDRIELKTANDNIKVTKPINAGGAFVRFTANGGMIDVTANILAPNNSAVFVADQEVKLSTVDVSGNAQIGDDIGGSIQIMANNSGSGGIPFTIGGSGHSNGVNGRLIARTATGGGSDPERWSGGVLVFNKGTGGIKLDSSSDIVVRATNSKNGVIVLDADEGSVEMPEGTISVNGQGGKSAGLISLLGSNINFTGSGKTILTASDTVSSGGLQHTVALAAENITFTSADGLELRANGDGDSTWISAVDLFPKGGLKVIIIPSGAGFQYTVEPQNGFDGTDAPLNINGPGNLNITANGSNSQIRATGNPVNFNVQGNVEFICNGKENNNIAVTYSGNSGQGLTVSSPTNLEFLANGLDDGDGGTITFSMPSIDLNTALSLTCRANGIGSGKGGAVIFNATNGSVNSVDDSLLLELIANGGQSGGDGGSVSVGASQDVTLVGATCRANGVGTGKGGTVTLNASQLASIAGCTITGSSDVEGDGGTVNIFGETIRVNELESTNPTAIRAVGGISTGSGGQINVNAQSAISVSDNVTITASALGNGFGGDISLVSVSQGVDLQGSGINILSKGAGVGVGASGDGGTITIKGNEPDGDISLEALIDASAGDIGDGGDITITGGIVNLGTLPIRAVGGSTSGKGGRVDINASTIEDAGALIHVFAETDGDGGIINLLLTGMEAVVLTDSTVLNASGGVEQGNGGSINIFAKGLFTVSQFTTVNANARAANNAKGGTIIVVMEDTFFLNGKLLANSGNNGDGGLIVINSAELNVMNGEVRASGNNGIINIFNGPGNNRPFRFTKTSTDSERGVIAVNGPTNGALSAGSISIANQTGEIIIDSGYALRANCNSDNAPGGSIFITSDSAKATINGILAANAHGIGKGGTITLNVADLEVTDGEVRAIGNDGLISIVDNTNGGSGSGGAFVFKKISGDAAKGTVSVNGNQSDGTTAGRIVLSKLSGDVTFDGLFAFRANGGNASNANGGNIEISAKRIVPASNGPVALTARGFGSGNGGKVIVFQTESEGTGIPFNFHPTGFSVDVSSVDSGDAGEITVASFGVVDFDGATCTANSGPNGNGKGGKTTVASTGSSINVGPRLFVRGDIKNNGTGSGQGGSITLAGQGIIFASGAIQANGGPSSGAGGEVIVNDSDTIATLVFPNGFGIEAKGTDATVTISKDPEVLLLGNASIGTSGAGSKLTFQPSTNSALTILIEADAKLIAESDSTILLTAGGNNLTINALSSSGAPIIGTLELAGDNIDCSLNSNVPLIAGNWAALEDISLLNSGNGTVSQITGSKVTGNKLTLDLTANFGVSVAPISTQVSSLQIDVGGAFLTNDSETLTVLDGAKSAGAISIEGNSISIGDLTSEAGSVSILATSGTLLVRQRLFGDGTLVANGGDLMIQGGSGLIVSTTDRLVAAGDISISIGPIGADPSCVQTTNTEPSCAPANVDGTVSNGGAIFWGAGISAAPGVTVDTNGRVVKIEPNGGALQLQAGVAVSAF